MDTVNIRSASALLILIAVTLTGSGYAQSGIGTRDPQGALHMDGAKDNAATVTPAQAVNDVLVTNSGFVGVGVLTPAVKLDMRSADTENAFGLGTTTMAASAAGAGAARYEPADNEIQISDGTTWKPVALFPKKATVVARLTTATSVTASTNTNIVNWDIDKDITGSFTSNGIFTAPRAGVYTFLLTYDFVNGSIAAGTRVEAQFVDAGTGTVLARSYKTFGKSHRNAQAGGTATVILKLNANQQVRPRLWQNIISSGSRSLRVGTGYTCSNCGFNNLTIIEH